MTPELTPLKRMQTLLDALNCGALMLDREGTIVYANHRFCTMMQTACDRLIGQPVWSFYPDEDDQRHLREGIARFDEDREEEFYLPLPDGRRLNVIYSARRVPGDGPLGEHRVVTMIDVSRQKHAETAIREQYQFIAQMSDTVLQQALELKHYSEKLEERVRQRTLELHEAHMEAIYMLAVAAEAKDQDTGHHVRRIQHYTRLLAEAVGLSSGESEAVGYSAILHDVGKIHIPDRILTKPGPLDDNERAQMQQHTVVGERILSRAAFFERARRIARSHHENWDGSGYPDGLAGQAIPIEARIVHVADVYDALTTQRVYKQPWPSDEALDAIIIERSRMFDPEMVDAFAALSRAGSLRRNGDDRSLRKSME
jgi:PAS domain S-box-containing protein/putative nucleotidyltransferase with HDIG domain